MVILADKPIALCELSKIWLPHWVGLLSMPTTDWGKATQAHVLFDPYHNLLAEFPRKPTYWAHTFGLDFTLMSEDRCLEGPVTYLGRQRTCRVPGREMLPKGICQRQRTPLPKRSPNSLEKINCGNDCSASISGSFQQRCKLARKVLSFGSCWGVQLGFPSRDESVPGEVSAITGLCSPRPHANHWDLCITPSVFRDLPWHAGKLPISRLKFSRGSGMHSVSAPQSPIRQFRRRLAWNLLDHDWDIVQSAGGRSWFSAKGPYQVHG